MDELIYCFPFIQTSGCRVAFWWAHSAYGSAVSAFLWTVVPLSAVFMTGARCVLQEFCKPNKQIKKRAI